MGGSPWILESKQIGFPHKSPPLLQSLCSCCCILDSVCWDLGSVWDLCCVPRLLQPHSAGALPGHVQGSPGAFVRWLDALQAQPWRGQRAGQG